MLNVLLREYGLKSSEALTQYTEEQLQDMISQIPVERVINIHEGMKKNEAEQKYLEAFFDRDTTTFISETDKYEKLREKADLKAKIQIETNPEIKKELQSRLDML
jgi:cell division protein FtsX